MTRRGRAWLAALLVGAVSWAADGPSIEELTAKAKAGDAEAQCELGRRYVEGKGVPVDVSEALIWYRKAAEQGDEQAQIALKQLGKAP